LRSTPQPSEELFFTPANASFCLQSCHIGPFSPSPFNLDFPLQIREVPMTFSFCLSGRVCKLSTRMLPSPPSLSHCIGTPALSKTSSLEDSASSIDCPDPISPPSSFFSLSSSTDRNLSFLNTCAISPLRFRCEENTEFVVPLFYVQSFPSCLLRKVSSVDRSRPPCAIRLCFFEFSPSFSDILLPLFFFFFFRPYYSSL